MQRIQVNDDMYISVPAASRDVVHVYRRNFPPRPPANLEHIDGMLWNEFSLHIAHIMRQIYASVAILIFSFICFVLGINSTDNVALVTTYLTCGFLLLLFSSCRSKKINKELKEIITEFVPKFENNGYGLEYFDAAGLFVFTRLPSSV